MTSQHVEFLVKLRDASLMIADATDEFLKSLTPPELGLEAPKAEVDEISFAALKWDTQKGAQLGDFEVACRASNVQEKWQRAFNILQSSNATIKERCHGGAYSHAYWVYGRDRIYRQKIKQ